MTATEYIGQGQLQEALSAIQESVRSKPQDVESRSVLFALQCVLGNWDKALTQLKVLRDLDPESLFSTYVYGPIIQLEKLREETFQGKRTPLVFGEPPEWIGLLIQANIHIGKSEFSAAQQLRDRALDHVAGTPGTVDGQPIGWLIDLDTRLGPVLELFLEGKYYWVPMERIARIEMKAPTDLLHRIWQPARFVWANGGEAAAHIPVRYVTPGGASEDSLLLARRTEWVEREGGHCFGLGQRMLGSDDRDFLLLDCRQIDLKST